MPFSSLRKTVHMAVETVYGTAPAFAGAQTFVAENFEVSPMEGEIVERNPHQAMLGASRRKVAPRYASVSFDVAMVARAAAATPAPYRAALIAGGWAETVQAGTSVTYNPISSAFGSAAILYNQDGEARVIRGIRGGVGLRFTKGEVPYLRFEGFGLYAARAAAAMAAQDYSGWGEPDLVVSGTTTFAAGAFTTAALESFELGVQNIFEYRNRPGQEGVVPVRPRAFEASISVLDEPTAVWDPEGAMRAETLALFDLQHGLVAGRRVRVQLPNGQITAVSETDVDGEAGRDVTVLATSPLGANADVAIVLS
jgi:hypothetical protein